MTQRKRNRKYLLTGHHSLFSSSFIVLIIAIIILISVFASFFFLRQNKSFLPSLSSLYQDWSDKNYETVYNNSNIVLLKKPLDGAVLALNGFSSFYLFAEQNDPTIARQYLVQSIISLRNAWYRVSESERPQIAYILGKAYYHKGYYFSDLALQYLQIAYHSGLHYSDLFELRGLAAYSLGDYPLAISSFTEALAKNPSDLLLFTLGQCYLKFEDTDLALQYFFETLRTTTDEMLVLRTRQEIGMIFLTQNKISEAQAEFEAIIKKDQNFADAFYGLGVIYELQGDLVRARASWRRALRSNPLHQESRVKLKI